MNYAEIVSALSSHIDETTSIVLYSITMQDVLSAIARRLDVSTLSAEDSELAREEVKEAINHHLNIREYIDMGWMSGRSSAVVAPSYKAPRGYFCFKKGTIMYF